MTAKFSRMLAICLLSSSAFGADLPSPSVSSSVGVNVTFTSTTASIQAFQNDMPMMAAAGIKFARMDFSWDLIEKTANTYDWSAYDSIVNSMIQYGIRPYFILHHSNLLYESCAVTTSSGCSKIYSPQNPNSIAAFSRWAVAAVNHFNDPHNFPTNPRIIWEIWNEPNSTSFWFARPDATSSPVDQYLNLAKATCTAIRSAAPSTTIVGPALSELDFSPSNPKNQGPDAVNGMDFMAKILDPNINLRSCLDAISVHPYRVGSASSGNPETVTDDYTALRSMMNTPSGTGTLPIISGEWGYYSAPLVSYGVTQMVQAALAVRQQLINITNSVPISIWYNWKDNEVNLFDNEANYGLVSAATPSTAKTSYTAIKTMTTELSGYTFQSRIAMSNPLDYALLFKNSSGHYRLVMWTRDLLHLTSPSPSGSPLNPTSSVDMTGNRSTIASLLGIPAMIMLTEYPQYIE